MEAALVSLAGDSITGDGQLEFRGYLLGDNENTFMDEITGWDDLPGIDSGNTPRSNSHGAWAGRKLANQRIITWSGRFSPSVPDKWEGLLKQLRSSFTIPLDTEEEPIVIQSIGEKKLCFGAVIQRSIPMNKAYGYYGANVTIQFECSDPRRYSLGENSWTLQLPDVVDVGLVHPLTYPLFYGVESTSSSGSLYNDGDVITPVAIVFNGPMTNPAIINQTQGVRLQFDIELGSGEFLEVNTRTGTVLLNGVADRLYTRTPASSPILSFGLTPGQNDMVLTADSWVTGSSADITWRDATI